MSGAYSNTYNTLGIQNYNFIQESLQRIGILPDVINPQMVQSATLTANLVLSEFINKGLNLFTVQQNILGLTYNQNTYLLPQGTNDILEAALRTSFTPYGGTASSSAGGTASNAFNGVITAANACTQTAPNGNISYNYGTNNINAIQMVGVISNVTRTYNLVAEYSIDGLTWINSVTMPLQSYNALQLYWFNVQTPTPAQYYRIRETGGATLNITQLYFNLATYDTAMTPISRSEWVWYPIKNQTGRPTQYWVDRLIQPTVTIWPVPVSPYNAMYYTSSVLIQDFGTLQNTPQISQQFYNAFIDGMAVQLARKYNMQAVEMCEKFYQQSFDIAARENRERVPVRVYGDYNNAWTQF